MSPVMVALASAGTAAKALGLLRKGHVALSRWNQLPAEHRSEAQTAANDVRRALVDLKNALAARIADDDDFDWAAARDAALKPSVEFEMAKALVREIRTVETATEEDLAEALGVVSTDDDVFEAGLKIAEEDGYIERTRLFSSTWRITEFADRDLVESDHVRRIESEIVEYLTAHGIADTDELASAVGAGDSGSIAFQAALERALASGEVEWLNLSTYGLPKGRLEAFAPPPEPAEQPNAPSLGEASAKLKAGVQKLLRSIDTGGNGRAIVSVPGVALPPAAAGANDPYEQLRKLGELRDAGLLTDEEFANKKSQLLAAI